ncbi:four-carbon acid sugar kinase family protein [Gephyromycinifex aptenodytis]|uniref:four-carbon acid sugar kinase family protein n=1 Tax=Gephyromycinifex aptenodytis TaxID=2716227 RepID=UPI001444E69F|nr:four-carbon acid sugar kinase family protein [Gephyromycinifex aptenodytis]
MATALHELLANRPCSPPTPPESLATRVSRTGRVFVVLDDDPTGTQSVADLPVLTAWDVDSLTWAFEQGRPAVYVMTNSRSLDPEDAARVNREVARNAAQAAERTGTAITFVSRSDSTLRGHFPLETDVLAQETQAHTGAEIDGVIIVPAFPDAGRITVGGIHYAGSTEAGFTPVGQTEFAADATFGYASSDLRDWVEEKTGGRVSAGQVAHIDLTALRSDKEAVVATLRGLHHSQPCVVDAVEENDLRLLASALIEAEDAGSRFLYRVGPPFPRARIGQTPRAPLSAQDVEQIRRGGLAQDAIGGLIVIGSHVALTTAQLDALRARRSPCELEIDVEAVLDEARRPAHLSDVVERAAAALGTGNVVVRTSRTLVRGRDAADSLRIARTVSAALVEVVSGVLRVCPPRFVVAKGGITSSDVASAGLGIARAIVRGPMLPGIVSLWEPIGGPASGIPYIVFAGNVGGPQSLADVVDILSTPALRCAPTQEGSSS